MSRPPPHGARPRTLDGVAVVGTATLVIIAGCALGAIGTFVDRHGSIFGTRGGTLPFAPIRSRWPASFPRTRPCEGLLDAPVEVPDDRPGLPDLVGIGAWDGGEPALLRTDGHRLETLGDGLASRTIARTDTVVQSIVPLRGTDGPLRAFALATSAARGAGGDTLVALDGRARTLWSRDADARGGHALAALYGEHGPVGVVVRAGDGSDLRAYDLDGNPRWNVADAITVFALATHPARPRHLLRVSGWFMLYDVASHPTPRLLCSSLPRRDGPTASTLGATSLTVGALLPGDDGGTSMVLGGHVAESAEPVVVCRTEGDRTRWHARPATAPAHLAVLEPPGRPRLVVFVTEAGDLHVLDEDGTLRASERVPRVPEGSAVRVSGFAAGAWGASGWVVALRVLDATWVFRLHPERLPPRDGR